jgi:hypothetical protein
MQYDDWNTVYRSGPLDFEIVAGSVAGGGTAINFSLRGQHVATIIGLGAGLGAGVGIAGTFTWNNRYASLFSGCFLF